MEGREVKKSFCRAPDARFTEGPAICIPVNYSNEPRRQAPARGPHRLADCASGLHLLVE